MSRKFLYLSKVLNRVHYHSSTVCNLFIYEAISRTVSIIPVTIIVPAYEKYRGESL
jgi:hypothetical protein